MRTRFATPFFDALRSFASSPVGQFHALPVAHGASIFHNSKSLQDMGEFYGRNIFMAETSSTSGGLDSLLDPHGNIKAAMDKAALTWNRSDVLLHQRDIDREQDRRTVAHPAGRHRPDRPQLSKSHHYGLVLAGANPLYLDAYRLAQFAIYGAVPCTPSSRPCSTWRPLDSCTGCGCCC